jgi:hypothetical protein
MYVVIIWCQRVTCVRWYRFVVVWGQSDCYLPSLPAYLPALHAFFARATLSRPPHHSPP